LYLYWM